MLQKKGLLLPRKCRAPLLSGYKPEYYDTVELKSDGMQWYLEIIVQLNWSVDLGRSDILLEVGYLSQQLVLPLKGHLEQALHVIGYPKEHKS